MRHSIRSSQRLLTALVGVAALALAVSALAPASSTAAQPAGTRGTALLAGVAARTAPRVHELHAKAGRAGAALRTIYLTVGVSSSDPAKVGRPRAVVQQLRSGRWRTVRTVVLRSVHQPPVTVKWSSRKAATLRVSVPRLGLVTPAMKVPAAPTSSKSRYYVRKDKVGPGGSILRVFKGGTAYGVAFRGATLSCLAGRLDPPWLRLTTFGSRRSIARYRTSGSWRRLTIHDRAVPVGGPRTSVGGKDKRHFRSCAAPTFASVTTAPTAGYPWHTNIVATTFWVGEIFDPKAEDGSQMLSTYDAKWFAHYGGCDGVAKGTGCATEARTAANGYFPRSMRPKENPFYLDLPFDDVNNAAALARRGSVIPWAQDAGYAGHEADPSFSYLKNRWVQITKNGRSCFGQIEDAGPGQYNDARYVFGTSDARPLNARYGGAGMDVSPALNGCLGFADLNGDQDRVSWRFVDDDDVPAGPWLKVVTRSPVSP